MNRKLFIMTLAGLTLMVSCKEKKQTQDIIAPRVETPKPQGPIRMQPYSDTRSIQWLDKEYKVEINRTHSDSLPMVKDETGQLFVDNFITVRILRTDGSVAISKQFTKATFSKYIDAHYQKSGILEGLVFDKVDGHLLEFAASVSLPQTDEYIPLNVIVDNFGNVRIERDSEMDTYGNEGSVENKDEDDEDGV